MSNRIRRLREERKMTQVRLSILLGVAQETVSSYENGKYLPSVEILIKIAQVFNVSLDYLLELSDIKRVMKEDYLSDEESNLLMSFKKLSPASKGKALAYVQGLYDAQV